MGKHSVKFGVDYRRLQGYAEAPNNASFGFTQAFTQGPNPNTASSVAGDAFASFLLGYPATGDVNVATPGTYYTDYYSAFMQDDYRITSKLSLNFGMRYEYEPGISAKDNRFTVGFDRNALFPMQVAGNGAQGRTDVCRRGRLSDASGATAEQRRAARRVRLFDDREDGDSRWLRPLLGAADHRHR